MPAICSIGTFSEPFDGFSARTIEHINTIFFPASYEHVILIEDDARWLTEEIVVSCSESRFF